jgi:hypothetical protein
VGVFRDFAASAVKKLVAERHIVTSSLDAREQLGSRQEAGLDEAGHPRRPRCGGLEAYYLCHRHAPELGEQGNGNAMTNGHDYRTTDQHYPEQYHIFVTIMSKKRSFYRYVSPERRDGLQGHCQVNGAYISSVLALHGFGRSHLRLIIPFI